MRRRNIVIALAACFVLGIAPVAQAGPGSAICKAATNGYETVTGDYAPWQCLQ